MPRTLIDVTARGPPQAAAQVYGPRRRRRYERFRRGSCAAAEEAEVCLKYWAYSGYGR
ncbi:hypothetical protein ACFXNW_20570 [Nocardia sp. NPDC059180]|uniref:hypothetical protein n=1 Tax=Nocardia sp. NPDC059180 TaxID=3346761 RepID=UPI00367E49B8